TINQVLDFDTAQTLAAEWGVELEILRAKTMEELFMEEFDNRPRDEEKLTLRPPVVTILGHVDHGKTSLLDRIRSANVAAGEAGGITQHIAAFSVELDRNGEKKRVTFIDTPGHQAFTAMRARGANMTDVIVLVIDAAQGIQPQTVESINHARAAGVPIVVAMNKIDLPDANPDMVMGQLAQHDLSPVAWGGTTEVVHTSGKTGQGIEELIEILDLQSQILELRCDPTSPARGTVIEGYRNPGLGPVATVLVQDGTLKVGDVIMAGEGYGRIRALYDSKGVSIQEAGPSMPVVVSGLNAVPGAGDKFFDIEDNIDRARAITAERTTLNRQTSLAVQNRASLQNISDLMKAGDAKLINLIVKADVAGSIETLEKTVMDQNTSEVQVKLIHAAVGPINESDVELATASDAVIIGFHVIAEPAAAALAEARKIEIRTYRVIYEIFDDLKKALSGMLEPEIREKHHGWIEIRQVFKASKIGNVAGCMVTEGHVSRGSKIRLTRDGNVITEGLTIDTLRRVKDDVKEVKSGFECGMKLAGYDDIKIGDRLEAYIREEIKRTL
ncbi:MAG TPA: translation initiation factor IF-2, partial [Tepidisphaeraceae bacterium]|nr:translation initiation factor IF-2 [Tepidisphaeraceae bacterium]